MGVLSTVRRFLSAWVASMLAIAPMVWVLTDIISVSSDPIEYGVILLASVPFAMALFRGTLDLSRFWEFVRTIWSIYIVVSVVVLAVVLVLVLFFGLPSLRSLSASVWIRVGVGAIEIAYHTWVYWIGYRKVYATASGDSEPVLG